MLQERSAASLQGAQRDIERLSTQLHDVEHQLSATVSDRDAQRMQYETQLRIATDGMEFSKRYESYHTLMLSWRRW